MGLRQLLNDDGGSDQRNLDSIYTVLSHSETFIIRHYRYMFLRFSSCGADLPSSSCLFCCARSSMLIRTVCKLCSLLLV